MAAVICTLLLATISIGIEDGKEHTVELIKRKVEDMVKDKKEVKAKVSDILFAFFQEETFIKYVSKDL